MRMRLTITAARALGVSIVEIENLHRARLLSWPGRTLRQTLGDTSLTSLAERLTRMLDSIAIARLNAQLFPEQFHASVAQGDALMCDDSNDGGMSRLEQAFFAHLGTLFPVDESLVDVWSEDNTLRRFVPVAIASHHLIEEGPNGHEPTPVLVLAYLLEITDRDDLTLAIALRSDRPGELPEALPPLSQFDFAKFKVQCAAKQRGEWLNLPMTISVMLRDTGNPFLDAWFEEPNWFYDWASDGSWTEVDGKEVAMPGGWTVENMRRLARTWEAAEILWNQYEAAVDWLEHEPERWPEIFAMWATCRLCQGEPLTSMNGGDYDTKQNQDNCQ